MSDVRLCVTPSSSMYILRTKYSGVLRTLHFVCQLLYMYVWYIRKSPLFAFSGALLVAKKMPLSLSGGESLGSIQLLTCGIWCGWLWWLVFVV